MIDVSRRSLLKGLAGILAVGMAPSIVRAASLMPVKVPSTFGPSEFIRFVRSEVQRMTGLPTWADYFDYSCQLGVAVTYPSGVRHGMRGPSYPHTKSAALSFARNATWGIREWADLNPDVGFTKVQF